MQDKRHHQLKQHIHLSGSASLTLKTYTDQSSKVPPHIHREPPSTRQQHRQTQSQYSRAFQSPHLNQHSSDPTAHWHSFLNKCNSILNADNKFSFPEA